MNETPTGDARLFPLAASFARGATLLFTLLLASVAQAAVPLSVELASATLPNRSEGPIPVMLRLNWGGPGVFDGRLLLSIVDEYEGTLARVETDELYLTEGEHNYALLLPSFHASGQLGELQLRITCLVDEEPHPLPPLQLRVPTKELRRLAMLVAGDGALQSPAVNWLVNSLKLEPFNPTTEGSRLSTVSQNLEANQLPEDPLLLCPYDLVVLPSGQWEHLSSKQLGALAGWVRAGGSLLLAPEDRVAKPQLAFLEKLVTASDRPELTFGVDTEGRLVLPEDEPVLHLRTDLGRVAVIAADSTQNVVRDDPAWRQTVAFLWKLQHAHLKSFVEAGVWNLDVAKQVANEHGISRGWNSGQIVDDGTLETMAGRLYPQTVSGGSGMLRMMMPSGLRLVPFGLMIGLLLLYVACIGPFDYWFLGMLRQRKLTWLLFPAVTIGFTWFAVWTSNTFMSSTNHRGDIVFRDMGSDGRILKESRFELLFPSRATTMTTDLRRVLYMPIDHEGFIAADWQYSPYAAVQEEQRGRSGAPLISGRPPQRMTVVQQIGQWTPQLNRTVTIPLPDRDEDAEESTDDDASPEFDWSEPVDWASPTAVQTAVRRIQQAFGNDAAAFLYHQRQRRKLIGPEYYFADETQANRQIYNNDGGWTWTPVDFLQDLCVRRQPGWFGVVSQTSPGCGRAIEDLALLDASDPDTWLLVIAVKQGEETVLYRKVYRQEQK